MVSWGDEDGHVGQKDSILLIDCYPLGPSAFGKFKLTDEKIEDPGRPPSALYMFVEMARRQPGLFPAVYGGEHLEDRTQAVERLNVARDDCPEFHNAAFIAETWGLMTYQFNIFVTEDIRYIAGQYGEGITFDKVGRFPSAPFIGGGASWNSTPPFDFDSPEGFWKMVVFPQVQQERNRGRI